MPVTLGLVSVECACDTGSSVYIDCACDTRSSEC